MRKTLTLSLAAAALALGGAAYAQSEASTDARPEARQPMTRAAVEQRTGQAFARMDANDDGMLNAEDRAARRQAAFDRLDTDDDGAISLAEFSARGEQRDEARAGGRAREGRLGPRMSRMGRMGALAADTNGDGAVSQAEFTTAALARFDQADANKDGTISRDERRDQWRDRRAGRQPRAG